AANDVGSMPYSSGGRPATALSATLVASWPSKTHAFVPSTRVMNCGARPAYFAGRRPSNKCGGSTTWSSTLTSTMSSMFIAAPCPESELTSVSPMTVAPEERPVSEYKYVLYEPVDDGRIVRVMLNRPEARNAQNRGLLVELNDAFLRAEADDEVRVVILGGMGPMFSSGHDLGSKVSMEELMPGPAQHPTRTINGATRKGSESLMLQEWHYFFDNTRRWRNLRKITIGQAHGDVFAAGPHEHEPCRRRRRGPGR